MEFKVTMKYNIGNFIWAMKDDKPHRFEIARIKILIITDTLIWYAPKVEQKQYAFLPDRDFIVEENCFLTKEDLLKSL